MVRRWLKSPWVYLGTAVLFTAGLVLAIVITNTGVEYKSVPRIPSIPTVAQTTVPSAAALPSAEPAPPPIPHDFVARDMPTHLKIGKVGESPLFDWDVDKNPALMQLSGPYAGEVLPPGMLPAVQNDPNLPWAGKPGSEAGTTVYACHAEASMDLPCNSLTGIDPSSNENSGIQAVETLPGGTLTSQLAKVHLVLKTNQDWSFMTHPANPNSRFIVLCDLEADRQTGQPDNTQYTRVLEFVSISSKAVGS